MIMNQRKTGAFISTARKEKKLTQAELAEMLSVSNKAVSKWETGRSFPDADRINELCSILGISVNELFNGEKIETDDYQVTAEQNIISIQKTLERNKKGSNRRLTGVCFLSFLVICTLLVFSIYSVNKFKKYMTSGFIQGTFMVGDELSAPEYIVVDQEMNIYKYHQHGKLISGTINVIDKNYYWAKFDNDMYILVYHTEFIEIITDGSLMVGNKISAVPEFINVNR